MSNLPETLDLAMRYHQLGDFAKAEKLYREILHVAPTHVHALHLLGLVALQTGRTDTAADYIGQAVHLQPDNIEAHNNLGVALKGLGRLSEAADCYEQALRLKPDYAEARNNLGVVLKELGKVPEAIACYEEALRLLPDYAEAHNNLGIAFKEKGQLAEAVDFYRRALRISPDHPEILHNLGNALKEEGKLDEAFDCYQKVVRSRPYHYEAHCNLGHAFKEHGKLAEAVASYKEALRIHPEYAEAVLGLGTALLCLKRFDEATSCFRNVQQLKPDLAEPHNFLGDALRAMGKYDDALAAYDRAIQLRPGYAEAHNNRGFTLDELRRPEEAIASFDEALRLKPDLYEAHHNRGVALGKLARYSEAIASFDQALRLVPDYPEARRNRALALLVLGDLQRGWQEFEWRWKCRDLTMPNHPRPLWEGEPLQGRTILLHVEQGLGDTLQFIRYAPLVKARGGRVVVECQKPLVSLVQTCPGIDQVVPKGETLPAFDVHTPLMRLMGLFKTTLETIPATIPYLSADAGRIEHWRAKLGRSSRFKVGIAWQGNPKFHRDAERSFPLTQLEGLARIEGVQLVGLQKGFGAEQLRQLGGRFPVLDLGDDVDPGLGTMRDTPAIMKCLDLIVTPDSALAHLAGALELPVWIALRLAPDWRWLMGREDSPWYPTARLFRQTERGGWGPVFDRMASALQERLMAKSV